MSFENGTVVWVKLKGGGVRLWWVGQVTTDFPDDLLAGNRTKPLAVVKFFSDETEFEIVKKEAEILEYNCPKKAEFIKKGKHHLAKNKDHFKKFIDDCKEAEALTGGSAEYIDSLDAANSTPKKPPEYAGLFKTTPVPQKSAHEYAGLVKLNFKKPGSSSKKPTPQIVEGRKYTCDQCSFTSDRVNVLTSHRKTHVAGTSTPSPSPAKSPAKGIPLDKLISPKKKTTPVKTYVAKRGKKRKAVVDAAPPAADKQDILADWSDADGDSPESPQLPADLEQKKPRTDQELSDAFESLLKTTKPPQIGENDSSQEQIVSDQVDEFKRYRLDSHSEEDSLHDTEESQSESIDHKDVSDVVEEAQPESVKAESLERPTTDISEAVRPASPEVACEKEVTQLVQTSKETKIELTVDQVESFETAKPKLAVSNEAAPETQIDDPIVTDEPTLDSEVTPELVEASNKTNDSQSTVESQTTEESVVESEITDESAVGSHTTQESSVFESEITTESISTFDTTTESSEATQSQSQTEETLPSTEEDSTSESEPFLVQETKNSPTAKVIGVSKSGQLSEQNITQTQEFYEQKPAELDDAEQLQNEVDALLAVTKPVEVDHEQLFAARPDLHYKVSPVQLKSELTAPISQASSPPSQAPVSPVPRATLLTSPTKSPAKSPMSTMPNVALTPRAIARPITTAQAMSLKANSAGELVLQQGGTGILKMTPKTATAPIIQEKIVILPPDTATTGFKSPPPGLQVQLQQQKSAFQTQQTVKLGSVGATPTPTIITSTPSTLTYAPAALKKTGRPKKQTLVERTGIVTTGILPQPTHGQLNPLTTAQFLSSVPGTRIQIPAPVQTVQSLQGSKVHALPTTGPVATSVGLRAVSPATATLRLAAATATTASKQFQQQRAASPAILTKPVPQFKTIQRQQGPTHYEIVASTAASAAKEGNEMFVVAQSTASGTQQFVLTSGATMPPGPHAMAITAPRKKAVVTKKAVPGPSVFKVPDVRPKPTAAVKPTLSEEEQLTNSDPRIRQALLSGQKTEKILTAEKVVHLLPIQNPDGTVTYMLVQLDDSGTGVRIDQAEGPAITGESDPIYVENEVSADKFLATIIHQNSQPTTPKKPVNRKSPANPRGGTPVAPRAKTPISALQQMATTGSTSNTVQPQVRQPQQAVQPRQFVIGQQQQLQQQFIQIQSPPPRPNTQTATSQQYQLIQSEPVATTSPSPFQTLQKPATISQQHVQRQVFASQAQQITLNQQQQVITSTSTQNQSGIATNVPVPELQSLNLQQQQIMRPQPPPLAIAPEKPVAQDVIMAEPAIQTPLLQSDEPQMPALIETKLDNSSLLQSQAQQQLDQQQVHYVIQSAAGELGDIQGMNMEIPLEMQEYMQVITGEDGNQYQYYITPESLVGTDPNQQAYYQLASSEGNENITYDYSGPEEQQFLILQDDGTLVSPQSLGMDINQLLTLQQQQQPLEQQQLQQGAEPMVQEQVDQTQNQPSV